MNHSIDSFDMILIQAGSIGSRTWEKGQDQGSVELHAWDRLKSDVFLAAVAWSISIELYQPKDDYQSF